MGVFESLAIASVDREVEQEDEVDPLSDLQFASVC